MTEKIKVNDEKDTAVIQKCFMMCTYLYNYVDIFKVKEENKKKDGFFFVFLFCIVLLFFKFF